MTISKASSNQDLTRREAIVGALAVTSGTVLSDSFGAETASRKSTPRVGIVGAGFAGLACAYELSQAGYVVDLFEARNRLGGRVHSLDRFAPGRVVEFGAELIGGNHPLWLKYATQFGIELEPLEDDGEPTEVVMDGHRYSGEEARRLAEDVDRGHDELAHDAATADWENPWNTANAEALDKQSLAQRINRLNTTERAKRAIVVEFLMDMACSPDKMNYLTLMCVIKAHGVEKYWTDTEMYRARQGNQILGSCLAAGISGKIHLDLPVTRIEQGAEHCVLTVRDGRKFEYSDVVLTVPPSVWNRIDFVPGLPAGFAPQMGSATKFLAVVDSDFWKPDGQSDLMTNTPLGMTWEGSGGGDAHERLLVSFAGGTIADDLHGRPFAERENLLRDEFERLLPGYAANHLKSEFVDWLDDPWTRGGYSFPLPGQFLAQSGILKEGLGKLHFAGEHSSTGFVGFMEGGLHSGVSVATKLAQRDGLARSSTQHE